MNTGYTEFSQAVIVADSRASAVCRKAVCVLVEEVARRTGITLEVLTAPPRNASARIVVGTASETEQSALAAVAALARPGAEGYRLVVESGETPFCAIVGEDDRGVLYGVGKLLRLAQWSPGVLRLPADTALSSAPSFSVRGHQLAYRPKTNAYDAWTPAMFDRYIRELALFGANTIDILPPGTDDGDANCLMTYDEVEMMCALSTSIHSYGMEVGVWYPNMFGEDIDEASLLAQEQRRDEIFARLPYADHLFIPGGDPGKLFPKKLFEVSERFIKVVRRHHQHIKLWLSPQTGCPSKAWTDEFYGELAKEPDWLYGLCFAPWERDNIDTLRARTPARYPIRNYADICHTLRCQYPVPKWDMTLALTLGREFVNPRPRDEKHIHNLYCRYMVGSVCYSEGINDDLNKFIWLDQEWNPDTPVEQTLREYGRFFIDCAEEEDIAAGMLLLEDNLCGEFATNPSVENAYRLWCGLEDRLTGYARDNYRLELHLLRACFDYYQQRRYAYEHAFEDEAMQVLAAITPDTADACMARAEEILNTARTQRLLPELTAKIQRLADALFEHIGAQLTVSRHFASAWDRGAFVECLDIPLNDIRYITARFAAIRALTTPEDRAAAVLDTIVRRTDPGPGGFYDDFGAPTSWDRLENHDKYALDPGFFTTPLLSFLMPPPHDEDDTLNVPLAWRRNVYTLYQTPLRVHYDGLDPTAEYTIRTVYGKYHPVHITLRAGEHGAVAVHDEVFVNQPFVQQECPLPKAAYADGRLTLVFTVRDGQRGPNVSEIMIRKL